MTNELITVIVGALAIAAVLGGGLFAAAWLIFWALEEKEWAASYKFASRCLPTCWLFNTWSIE